MENDEPGYHLRGVVRHIGGTASSGHYTAYCEREKVSSQQEKKKEWVSFDDGLSNLTSLSNVIENERNRRSVYMMVYST